MIEKKTTVENTGGGTPANRIPATVDCTGHLPGANQLPEVAALKDEEKLILREALAALKKSEETDSILYRELRYLGAFLGICHAPGTVEIDHATEKMLSRTLLGLHEKGYITEHVDQGELMTFMGRGQLVLAYRLTPAGRAVAEALETPVNPL